MHLPPVRKLGFCEVVAPSPDYARRRREMLLLVLSALRQVMGAGHVLRELRQPGPEEALPVSTRPTSSAVGWDSVSRSRPRAQLLGFAREDKRAPGHVRACADAPRRDRQEAARELSGFARGNPSPRAHAHTCFLGPGRWLAAREPLGFARRNRSLRAHAQTRFCGPGRRLRGNRVSRGEETQVGRGLIIIFIIKNFKNMEKETEWNTLPLLIMKI